MIISQPKIGKDYKIIGNRAGHAFVIGDTVRVLASAGGTPGTVNSLWRCIGVSGGSNGLSYSVYANDMEVRGHTRKERLEINNEDIAEMEKKIASLREENDRLSKYPTDEDEVAALIVAASDTSKPETERVAAIAEVLRQRTKLNGNTDFI